MGNDCLIGGCFTPCQQQWPYSRQEVLNLCSLYFHLTVAFTSKIRVYTESGYGEKKTMVGIVSEEVSISLVRLVFQWGSTIKLSQIDNWDSVSRS